MTGLPSTCARSKGLPTASVCHSTPTHGAQWYRITMGTRPENIERAITGIKEEIHAIRKASFSAEEIQKVINAHDWPQGHAQAGTG